MQQLKYYQIRFSELTGFAWVLWLLSHELWLCYISHFYSVSSILQYIFDAVFVALRYHKSDTSTLRASPKYCYGIGVRLLSVTRLRQLCQPKQFPIMNCKRFFHFRYVLRHVWNKRCGLYRIFSTIWMTVLPQLELSTLANYFLFQFFVSYYNVWFPRINVSVTMNTITKNWREIDSFS